ncbi:MAG TPA: hypothetical protein VFM88_03690 [Vicinamibacteria bacterium]|nr:hypothetical protein [Vicinamibacteria bacterium]
MIVACRYCERLLPATAPYDSAEVWEATCALCASFRKCEPPAVLVISRSVAQAAPALEELLTGVPNLSVIVDRRIGPTRGDAGGGAFLVVERRRSDRRRGGAMLLA